MKKEIDTSWMTKGTRCWVYDIERSLYVKARIIDTVKGRLQFAAITCQLEDRSRIQSKILNIERRSDGDILLSNLVELEFINDAEILYQLSQRFRHENIFTFIGTNLLAINPYKLIAKNYDNSMIEQYHNDIFVNKISFKDVQPHIFGLVSEVLKEIGDHEMDQAIVISGQSGAGKTETNKYCLKYLTHVCGGASNPGDNMEQKIMSCSPILEAFGNAKTVRNDNSSRFGKLTTLKIHKKNFSISEAEIRSYFLEKSRIPSQNGNQLNFHIFFYFVKGLPPEECAKYFMKNSKGQILTVESFNCLRKKSQTMATAADYHAFAEIREAFRTLKFTQEEQNNVWSIVAAVLHLSNVSFDHSGYEATKTPGQIIERQSFKNACKLLGLDQSRLERCLLFRSRVILNEQTLNPQPQEMCKVTRDSMMKVVYDSLFQWLVSILNKTLKQTVLHDPNDYKALRLLDIYGFEVFQENSFQQLCVNYTNERIHQVYIEQIFKQEKKIFEDEGIGEALATIHFNDNRRIIELLDTDPFSVFNLLDESCSVNTDSNGFLNSIRKNLVQKPNEVFPDENRRLVRKAFIVRHTPCQIEYAVVGFRQKNRDEVRDDLLFQLSVSQLPLLREIFKKAAEESKGQSMKKRFLGRKIRQSIGQLIKTLQNGTDVHFIRCIKPNQQKKPFTFVPKMALTQIKYLGLLDTLMLRKATYHIRIPYHKFHQKYFLVEFPKDNKQKYDEMAGEDQCQTTRRLFRQYFGDSSIQRLFGVKRIFMKQGSKPIIDRIYNDRMKRIMRNRATMFQYFRAKIDQAKAQQEIGRYKKAQKIYPYMKTFIYNAQREQALKIIEGFFTYDVKLLLKILKNKRIKVVQQYFRRSYEMLRLDGIRENRKKIDNYLKAFRQHVWFRRYLEVENFVKKFLVDAMWSRNRQLKIGKIQKYVKSIINRAQNHHFIEKAEENTQVILTYKFQVVITRYVNSFKEVIKLKKKLSSILLIQSFFRKRRILMKFREMRKMTIVIQRAWRSYYQKRLMNIMAVKDMFAEYDSRKNYSILLFNESLHRSIEKPAQSIENVFKDFDNVKTSKISLFYYILDLEQIVDVGSLYQNYSWLENYLSIFRQSFSRNNPIQYLQVGERHTLAANYSKMYSWGCNDYEQLGIDNTKVPESTLNSIPIPNGTKVRSFEARDNYSTIELEQPPSKQMFGRIPEEESFDKQNNYYTLRSKFTLMNGTLVEIKGHEFIPLGISDKVVQVACGFAHVICRTSLKKILSWGDNAQGQLGHGHYLTVRNPTPIQFFSDQKHMVIQVAAGSRCCIVVYSNHKIFWFGTNGTITRIQTPEEVRWSDKSDYLSDGNKYTPIRAVCTWSKTMSVIGITFAWHNGVLPTNISLKRKILQQLATKWNEQDVKTILPPYIRSITHYFTEKCMRMPVYKPNIEMESRKKLKELRQNILLQLHSLKYLQTDYEQPIDSPSQI